MLKENNNLVVPVITPRLNSEIDWVGLENLINFLIEGGVSGIFILGTTGEFINLSLKEKALIIESSIKIVAGRASVLVGVSADSTSEILELISVTNLLKPTAIVLAPLYGGEDAEEMIGLVIENSELPIILYNNPDIQNKQYLDFEIINKFSNNDKVTGIKDSSGDAEYFIRLTELSSPKFLVFQGSETSYLKSPKSSPAGLVSGSGNVYPKEFSELLDNPNERTVALVRDLKNRLKEVSPNAILGIKTMLMQRKIIESNQLYE